MATAGIPKEVRRLMAANDFSYAIAQAIAVALAAGLSIDDVKAELERAANLLED